MATGSRESTGGERRRRRSRGSNGGGILGFLPKPIRRFVPGTLVVIVAIFLLSVFSGKVEEWVAKVQSWLKIGEETPETPEA